jgi:hypothetical protein
MGRSKLTRNRLCYEEKKRRRASEIMNEVTGPLKSLEKQKGYAEESRK